MSPATIFQIHLVLGYVPWLLCFGAYIWPKLKAMDQVEAQRAIATLHSFRFFGLVLIVPGVVGPKLPAEFAAFIRADVQLHAEIPVAAVAGLLHLGVARCARVLGRTLRRDDGGVHDRSRTQQQPSFF